MFFLIVRKHFFSLSKSVHKPASLLLPNPILGFQLPIESNLTLFRLKTKTTIKQIFQLPTTAHTCHFHILVHFRFFLHRIFFVNIIIFNFVIDFGKLVEPYYYVSN